MSSNTPSVTPDLEAIHARYLEERDKRIRPDGNEQYLEPTGKYAHFLDDPHTERVEREPLFDEVTVCVYRRWLRWAAHRSKAATGRDQRCAHHRERWRLRRHVVLEPLPRCTVRHCRIHLPPAPGRNRSHADRKSTPMPPRYCSTAGTSGPSLIYMTRHCSAPKSQGWSGTMQRSGGLSRPTVATRCLRSTLPWEPARCTAPKLLESTASTTSTGMRSTPAAGTTSTPVATRAVPA